MDKEFVLHFVVTLEKNSWYYDDNKELAGDPSSIDESMYSLGLYCNVIGFKKNVLLSYSTYHTLLAERKRWKKLLCRLY